MKLFQFFAHQKSPEGIAANREYGQGEAGLHRLAGWSFDQWERWRQQFQDEFSLHWANFVKGHNRVMGLPVDTPFTGVAEEAYNWMNEHLKLIEGGWNPENSVEFLYEMHARIQVVLKYTCDEQNEPYRKLSIFSSVKGV